MPCMWITKKFVVQQIRSSVHDLIGDDPKYNDRYLLKWLVARRYDVKKSEEMLRKVRDQILNSISIIAL